MALQLKQSIVRNAVFNSAVCVLACMAAAKVLGLDASGLPLLAAAAGGAGVLSFRRTANRIRASVMQPLQELPSYVRIERDSPLVQGKVDWRQIDDYALQLATRGYRPVGEFTGYPVTGALHGVAALFSDADATTVIEVQQLQLLPAAGPERLPDGIYFNIMSLVGGNIRVTTCSHPMRAGDFLMRGSYDVTASHPDLGLLALLEQHAKRLASLQHATGKQASPGLQVERYLIAIREAKAQARQRLAGMGGLAIAGIADRFAAAGQPSFAPPSSELKALPERPLCALDGAFGATWQPPIFEQQD